MKSKLIEEKTQDKPLDYPVLMQSKTNGQIVLFTEEKKGTVLNSGNSGYDVGCHSESWESANNKDTWQRYTGSVNLSND